MNVHSFSTTNIVFVALLIVVSVLLLLIPLFLKKTATSTRAQKAKKLVEFFRTSSDERARLAALSELGWIDNEIAKSELLVALRDRNLTIRESAVHVLGAKGKDAVRRLREAEALVRTGIAPASAAYWATLVEELTKNQQILRDYILPGLIAASRDTDARVREAALSALKGIGTREASSSVNPGKESIVAEAAQFSAYYPKQAKPGIWYPLYGYICRSWARGLVRTDAAARLKLGVSGYGDQSATASIVRGANIGATLVLDGIEVNPATARMGFLEDWQCFEFRIRAPQSQLGRQSAGFLTFAVEGVIVADVPLSVLISEEAGEVESEVTTRDAYQAIFCSYSHEDMAIVKRVEAAYKAIGMDYLRDICSIRSGEKWDERLRILIAQADIFQLFWSLHSSISASVRKEWKHALALRGKEKPFIRPVYWVMPMPPPPTELADIHFAYCPELATENGKEQ
jgi:hypothetical protein